ncbi:MAG TPA: DUF5723 family protein [Bacteroidia bacterium]|nr:DUF5723 family protein [Bacteroidia bacterium]
MKNRTVKYLTFLTFILGSSNLQAQQDLTLYNMPAIQQSMYANPSQMPQSKINIGLPILSSIYLNLGNSGFRATDLIKSGPGDSNHLDVNNMLSKLGTNNNLNISAQIDLFSFGLRLGKNYFSFSVIEKADVYFTYPKNFLQWVWEGNGAFLGQNTSFNFGLNALHYREYGVGYARELTDKLTIGGKLKYLYGMEDIWAENSDVTFNTASSDYGYTTSDNVDVNTSGFGPGTNPGSNIGDYLHGRNNTGLAVDLGATYKLNDKFTFSASLIDLGYINWRSYTSNYTSNGAFNFDGVDITQFTSGDTNAFNKLTDSAKNAFNIKTTHKSYTTSLPAQVYLGANYKLSEKANAGLLLYGQFFNNILVPAVSASYNLKLTNWFSVSAAYSIMNRDATNVGVGFAVTGPVQFYLVTDNAIGFFLPQEVKTVNVRFGINLCFGRKSAKAASDSTKASFQ